jgi:hypothetical protein
MMPQGKFTVIDCPACDDLHPVYFDETAGIDGDPVYNCPVARPAVGRGRKLTTCSGIGRTRARAVMAPEKPICVPLDPNDIRQCRVRRLGERSRGCTIRASHFVTWPTTTGASGSYRCRVHAREFADKYEIQFKE